MNILLLEDDLILSSELSKFLEQKGAVCTKIFSGDQLETLLSPQSFDLYLLDIHVPKINGLEICTKIREKNALVPIVMISAYGELSDKTEAYSRFADDYLVKPFHFDELWLKINSLLRRRTKDEANDDVLTIDNLVINKTRRVVSRGGMEINLTLKEFQLLLFLAEAQGRVLSKQEITEQVWEHNFNTNTNTVEVYINFLRKKIDKDFSTKLIHTRSGFGYFIASI